MARRVRDRSLAEGEPRKDRRGASGRRVGEGGAEVIEGIEEPVIINQMVNTTSNDWMSRQPYGVGDWW